MRKLILLLLIPILAIISNYAFGSAQSFPEAVDVATNTSAFNGNLSSADNTVQKALDTIDNMQSGVNWTDTINLNGVYNASGWTHSIGKVILTNPTDKIGIGTTNPSFTLDIANGVIGNSSSGDISIEQSVNDVSSIVLTSADENISFYSVAGSAVFNLPSVFNADIAVNSHIAVNATSTPSQVGIVASGVIPILSVSSIGNSNGDYLTIASNGNVGIGTPSPSVKLEVSKGNFKITTPSNGTAAFYYGTSTSNYASIDYNDAGGLMTLGSMNGSWPVAFKINNVEKIRLNANGNFGIGSINPTAQLEIKNNGTDLFHVTNSIGGDYLTVTSAGSVGIGTYLPVSSLDVYGNTGTKKFIGRFSDQGTDDIALLMNSDSKAARPAYGFTGFLGTGMFLPAAYSLAFSSNSVERIRITSNGNVGIGSTAPISKLDVNGAIRSANGATDGSVVCWKSDRTLGVCATLVGVLCTACN